MKAILVFLTVVAGVIGFLPAALFLARPRWLLYFAIAAALFAALSLHNLKQQTAPRPRLLEFLLGFVAAIFPAAACSLFVMLFYWLSYGPGSLLSWLVGALGWHFRISPDRTGFYVASVCAGVFGLGYPQVAAVGLWRELFPATAGIKSPFYTLITTRRSLLMWGAAAAFAGIVVIVLFASVHARWYSLTLNLYLIALSSGLWTYAQSRSRPTPTGDMQRGVSRLLENLGFTVVFSPRTGDPGIDPLLPKVDLFAHLHGRAFAIQIKSTEESKGPVAWTDASSLAMAASSLVDSTDRFGLGVSTVEPVMVLVEREPSSSLERFTSANRIRIIQIGNREVLSQALQTQDMGLLKRLAIETFGPLLETALDLDASGIQT